MPHEGAEDSLSKWSQPITRVLSASLRYNWRQPIKCLPLFRFLSHLCPILVNTIGSLSSYSGRSSVTETRGLDIDLPL